MEKGKNMSGINMDVHKDTGSDTKIIRLDAADIDQSAIQLAGQLIRSGELVAFPTETVYGLGADALSAEASRKIYSAKGRPSDNPLIVHIYCMEDVYKITAYVPESARKLAETFWPGPLTMVLAKNERVPYETTGGLDTVAVRMPANPIALALIRESGGYIAAPSANVSGRPSPTLAGHVYEDLKGKIPLILDGGEVGVGIESAIVDLTEGRPVILRPGYITKEMLEAVLKAEEDVDKTLLEADSGQAPRAPGMKYRHYAPKGEMTVVFGQVRDVTCTIQGLVREKMLAGEKVGVICTEETKDFYSADFVVSAGTGTDEEMIARRLYGILRQFDRDEVTYIYSEAFSDRGIGQAVMNRLLKAAGYHMIET